MTRTNKILSSLLAAVACTTLVASATPARAAATHVTDLTRKDLCNRLRDLYDSINGSKFFCTLSAVNSITTTGVDPKTLPDLCRQKSKDCKSSFFPQSTVCSSDDFKSVRVSCDAKVSLLDGCFTDLQTRVVNALAPLNDAFTCSVFDPLATGDVAGFEQNVMALQTAMQQAQTKLNKLSSRPLPRSCTRLQAQCSVLQTVAP